MKIEGVQKLTLLDFPGRVACTVFTHGCNFRCPFCHNAPLVIEPSAANDGSEEEFFKFLSKRTGILDGVCITGGEPMLQQDLENFMCRIKDMGFLVKLDTNGSFPERLKALIDEGLLDYVAVDIKNSPLKYKATAGCGDAAIENVKKTVQLLMQNRVPYEFRTTVVNELHEAADFHDMGSWLKDANGWFLQKFVDSGSLIQSGLSAASEEDMRAFLEIAKQYVPSAQLRGM